MPRPKPCRRAASAGWISTDPGRPRGLMPPRLKPLAFARGGGRCYWSLRWGRLGAGWPAFSHRFEGVHGIMRESVAVKRSASARKSSADDVVRNFIESIDRGKSSDQPYRHWSLKDCLPSDTLEDVL